ncbi:MAG: putative lipid II flippase FtsW [Gammaproteobacteria bacterium]|nr:putative lipid II flippase FtsW [Gammaproteobacteria bacterium]
MSAVPQASRERTILPARVRQRIDVNLIIYAALLLGVGLVMVSSASLGIADSLTGDPLYYFKRQLIFIMIGLVAMAAMYGVRLEWWRNASQPGLIAVVFLLALVLIPGAGKTVNGSSRWLAFGGFSLQVSELAKLFVIVYLAAYIDRHAMGLRTGVRAVLPPLAVLGVIGVLLLLEPDYGAAAVLLATSLGMLFLGGVRLWQCALLLTGAGVTLSTLAMSSPYRLERITAFVNPWADPYDTGFQLTQSLIAIGSGSWWGVGLGDSIQKLFYLPEAHTDFLFAVVAEELGLAGMAGVIALYSLLVWRSFTLGRTAERCGQGFAASVSYGIGMWLGLQAFINMGVNLGILPTKGLTLPLMSAGGSSIVVVCVALGLLLRVHCESCDVAAEQTS